MKMSASKLIFIAAFFILTFNGLWEFIGLPTFITKISFFSLLLLISTISVLQNNLKLSRFEIILISIVIPYLISVYLIYPNISTIISLFQLFSPLIILILLRGITYNSNDHIFFQEFFKYFIILQVFSALIKLVIIGQGEGQGIGSISIQAGSLSTFIGLTICIYALNEKLKGNSKTYITFFILAFIFVVINEKRLGIIVVGSLAIYSGFFASKNNSFLSNSLLKPAIGIITFTSLSIIGAKYVPTLIEGYSVLEFDERVWTYLTAVKSDGTALGRLAGLFKTYEDLLLNNSILFGMGPEIYLSSNISGVSEELFNPIGVTILFGRFGIFGLLVWFSYFIFLYRNTNNNPLLKIFVLYLFFDFIIYSNSIFLSHSLVLIYIAFYNSQKLIKIQDQNKIYN